MHARTPAHTLLLHVSLLCACYCLFEVSLFSPVLAIYLAVSLDCLTRARPRVRAHTHTHTRTHMLFFSLLFDGLCLLLLT